MLFFIKDIVLLKPFFSYIVAIHEFCHAFATIITGGNVHQIMLYQQGGHALTSGGFFPLIAISGYIGTTLIGAILIYFSINDKINKYNLRVLSISIFLIYLFYYKICLSISLFAFKWKNKYIPNIDLQKKNMKVFLNKKKIPFGLLSKFELSYLFQLLVKLALLFYLKYKTFSLI